MIKEQFVLEGKHNLPILSDITLVPHQKKKPLVIFVHGYKGFKDWGCWHLVAEEFAKAHMCFLKFNFSHNGGTVEQPIDFPDLKAFGNNNYVKELDDIQAIIDYFTSTDFKYSKEIDTNAIYIIGHSRGGGIITISAAEDSRLKKLVSWAGVSDFESRFPTGFKRLVWRLRGVGYVENSRTKQKMPHYYQFYKNFIANRERLNIKRAVQKLNIPILLLHGDTDATVPLWEAEHMKKWNPTAQLEVIPNGDHVFSGKHPWDTDTLPEDLMTVTQKTIAFLKAD
ncbi:hypothetical protein NBRC110019_21490 [Neptunitalea chrysea]|uniref:Peptidase S9 prolyl oligopeptidase catalytic domain-containing protein n=1 Tax=Neptunitalea chrysea TaxID=1647581 RepID=A0A9W6B5Q3_9FLAO|nr:alpha/beta fold hydrolase [Neptunitalea chrysea]GLB53109.1 hypothetical protein NBRC110019_21490 [Neptunitalea chrysea]